MNIYKCQKCGSGWIDRTLPVETDRVLDVKPPVPVCKKCGAELPWLGHRDYGVNYREQFKRDAYDREVEKHFGSRRPLWMIPGKYDNSL